MSDVKKTNIEQIVDTSLTREEVELKAIENQKKIEDYKLSHNKFQLTRRDLMASGVISRSALRDRVV
jgi:hypothetical protein